MRIIEEKALGNICKYRAFTFYEDSHARGYYFCKLDNRKPCEFQCTIQQYESRWEWEHTSLNETEAVCQRCFNSQNYESNFCPECGAKMKEVL